jgi:hypothetical protein
MRKMFALLLAVLLVAAASPSALAQGIDGTLRGEVKDPSGALIPGAKVTVTNEKTGLSRTLESSASGSFNLPNLLIGSYTITVEATGFKKAVRKGVEVKANQIVEASMIVEIGAVTDVIEVVAGAELVQITNAQLGTSWTNRELTEVPLPSLLGDPQNLAILQTGTTTQAGGVVGQGGAIGGNRPRNNNFVIDGIDNNDVGLTGPNQPVAIPDAVGEFTLLTNQFSAEYGHSTAGQFITTTKSGTNEFHGSGFWFVNNRHLNSGDNLTNDAIRSGSLSEKPRFDSNRLGTTFGGPIIRDKLFGFAAYQYTTQGQASTPGSAVFAPTAAGFATLNMLATSAGSGVSSTVVNAFSSVIPAAPTADPTRMVTVVRDDNGAVVPIEVGVLTPSAPNFLTQHDWNVNVDWQPKDHRFSFRVSDDRFRAPFVASLPLPIFTGSQLFDVTSYLAADVWTLTPNLVNEFRAGYRRTLSGFGAPNLTPPGTLDVYPNFILSELDGLELGPDGNTPQSGAINTYQWVDTLSYLRGRHTWKMGVDVRLWIAPNLFLPRSRAEYRYTSLSRFVKDLVPDELALRGVGDGSFAGNQKGVYWFVQDDWKIHPRFTLNLGLRYEFATNPRDAQKQILNSSASLADPSLSIAASGNPALQPLIFGVPKQDINNFAPRIGFAYDVFGDHKTAIRGGFGIGYDVVFQNLTLLQLPPQLQQELNTIAACNLAAPPAWCATQRNFIAQGGLPGTFVPQQLSPAAARSGTQAIIVDTVAPVTYTWSLGVQHEFLKDYSVEVRYVGTRGLRLPVQIRRNAGVVPPDSAFLPTYFSNSDVPANVAMTAPSLADFQAIACCLHYEADGFDGGFITAFDPVGNSIYHAGSVELTRRMTSLGRWGNGLFVRSGYTWSKAIDDSTNELFTSQVNPRRPESFYNLRNERGLSTIHHEHKFTLATIYEFPKYAGENSFLKHLFNLWQISSSYIAETGQPTTALSGIDANGNFDSAGDRAIFNPGGTSFAATDVNEVCRGMSGATSIVAPGTCAGSSLVGYVSADPAAQFVRARPGARTNIGRNTLSSAGLNNWNVSIFKRTNISERYSLEFRTEMLNAFNHPQPILGNGNITINTANAINGTGLIRVANNPNFQKPENIFSTGAGNAPFSRLIQFGLKLVF